MRWSELLFLHWPVDPAALQRLLPEGVVVDTWRGDAWLGIVPFRMGGTRLRGLPPLPGAGAFPELNVRTYVRVGDRNGVWFFSLDAASRLAVAGARAWFGLPYFHAEMAVEQHGQLTSFTSRRLDRRGPGARLAVGYCSGGASRSAEPGSLEHFLVERYCLFAARPSGTLLCGEIAHAPWQLQPASVQLGVCDMTRLLGLELGEHAPFALCTEPQSVVAWAPRRIR
jgi:uncharacterized protein YqjF (DUF2071 family)